MFRVKICGITRVEDVLVAVESGADAIGINFWRQSPRYLDPSAASEIVRAAGDKALVFGVFVNEPVESITAIAHALGLGAVQLSGDEPAELAARLPFRVLKAIRPAAGGDLLGWADYPCEALLLDAHRSGTYGGTGLALGWADLPARVKSLHRLDGTALRWCLAGGLTPENVREAIISARPFGVDVASGVESAPGKKDPVKVAEFIQRAKEGLSIAGT